MRNLTFAWFQDVRIASYSHNDNCLFILDVEEVHGEERLHSKMETEKGEIENREKGEDND